MYVCKYVWEKSLKGAITVYMYVCMYVCMYVWMYVNYLCLLYNIYVCIDVRTYVRMLFQKFFLFVCMYVWNHSLVISLPHWIFQCVYFSCKYLWLLFLLCRSHTSIEYPLRPILSSLWKQWKVMTLMYVCMYVHTICMHVCIYLSMYVCMVCVLINILPAIHMHLCLYVLR